jgi:N-acetylneuraminate synthase
MPVQIIAEIGINHNGSMETCKNMMLLSKVAGANYAKIQKREPDICVPEEQKTKRRMTPWGEMSYLDYKKRIEFNEDQIVELIEYGKSIGIELFASVWDKISVDVMARHSRIGKIGSALITNLELCAYAREKFDTLIISTGMSTEEEIENCIRACSPDVIMHSNSTYPCPTEELNLRYIEHMRERWGKGGRSTNGKEESPEGWHGAEIGYSGHEYGLVTTFAAVAKGSTWVERHITMDRNEWGSDQKSSIEPSGIFKLVKGIRAIEGATKYKPGKRILFDGELIKRKSLRGV